MKVMIAMIIDCERKESEFIWDGELSASGCQEPIAISSVHLKCRMLAIMMHDSRAAVFFSMVSPTCTPQAT